MALEIRFENSHFVLMVKPAGMNFHSEGEAGFVARAKAQLGLDELYPVHRLDKMTSGLVLLARTQAAARQFGELFEKRGIEKYYLAISLRRPKKKQGWIKGDMAKARRGDWKLLKTTENPAITRFLSAPLREGERAFLVRLYTGRTHQIRVALKSLGAPIAGDLRYARSEEALKEERGYLHAYALRFCFDGEEYRFISPPQEGERFSSDAFRQLLDAWGEPWHRFA